MRWRLWLRYALPGAFVLSLLLHVSGILGEEIYAWLTRPDFEWTELTKPRRELKALSLVEDPAALSGGAKSPGSLDVYLNKVQQPKPVIPPSPRPVKKKARTASPVVALKPAPVSVVEKASAVAARPVEQIASAPVIQHASAPAAASPLVPELARFPRELKITYVWEYFPVPAHMTWKVDKGRYDLRLEGGFLGITRTFVSTGRAGEQGVIPERFVEYRNGKPEPFYQADFDWSKMGAEVGKPGARKSEKIAAGDQDIFSTAFHIGLIGGSKSEYTFSMFSGRRKYENVRLKVAGEAKLQLGGKEIDALLIRGTRDNRRVDFWLVPEWHNIPVRLTILLGNDLTLDLWASEVVIDGRKVLEQVLPASH